MTPCHGDDRGRAADEAEGAPPKRSRLRRVLEDHPSIAVGACFVWATLFTVANRRGTVGLSRSRSDFIRSAAVFLGIDRAHRGDETWAFIGLGLTLVFLALIGWCVLLAVRNRRRR